ncbi:hypothetical protein ABK040_016370 [Willaertia magna]
MKSNSSIMKASLKPLNRRGGGTAVSQSSKSSSKSSSSSPRELNTATKQEVTWIPVENTNNPFSSKSDKKDPIISISNNASIKQDTLNERLNAKLQNDLDEANELKDMLNKLSEEQFKVLQCVLDGHSIFLTGVAGTGKSMLLECMIRLLRDVHNKNVAITASTGISAVNIGGSTIHSMAGIRSKDNGGYDVKTAWRNEKTWRSTDVLIIDEISMIDGEYFDKLEEIATEIRCSQQIALSRVSKDILKQQLPPFGGIQLIITGDFAQLPPVQKSFKNDVGETVYQKKKMAFQANTWDKCIKYTFELTKVFRQEEKEWIDILNKIRLGRKDDKMVKTLKDLERNRFEGMDKSTIIHTLNKNVDGVNEAELAKLKPPQYNYNHLTCFEYGEYEPSKDGMDVKNYIKETLLSNFNGSNAAEVISLRIGAQVMLTKNDFGNYLVNGTRGEIIDFVKVDASDFKAENKNLKPYAEEWIKRNRELLPKVLFTREENGKEVKAVKIVYPAIFESDGPLHSKGIRLQVPLKLAYAMTVHKTQGLTLQKCVIDLAKVFSAGQIYVALSRAKNMKYLCVKNLNPYDLTKHVNHQAIEYYRTINQQNKYITANSQTPKDQLIENWVYKMKENAIKKKKTVEDRLKKIEMEKQTKKERIPMLGLEDSDDEFNFALPKQGTKRKEYPMSSSASSSSSNLSFRNHNPVTMVVRGNIPSSQPAQKKQKPTSRVTKYYAVANGRRKGIYLTWDECKAQVDEFQGARYKSFKTLEEANDFLKQNMRM